MRGRKGSSIANDYKYASQPRFSGLITCTVVTYTLLDMLYRTISFSLGLWRAQRRALHSSLHQTVRQQHDTTMRNSRGWAVSWCSLAAGGEGLRKSSSHQQ